MATMGQTFCSQAITVTNAITVTQVWTNWNTAITAIPSCTVTGQNVWQGWNTVYATQGVITYNAPLSDEERKVYADEIKKSEEAQKNKEEKAEQLLVSFLDENQKMTWQKEKKFDVLVKGKVYQLRKGNKTVLLDEKGKAKVSYCIHPDWKYELPDQDVLLCHKLMLETDEEQFLSTANATKCA